MHSSESEGVGSRHAWDVPMNYDYVYKKVIVTIMMSCVVALLVLVPLYVWAFWLPSTKYSADYSEKNFNALKPGDATDKIVAQLGLPIRKSRSPYPITYVFSDGIECERTLEGGCLHCARREQGKIANAVMIDNFQAAAKLYGPQPVEKRSQRYEIWEYSESANDHNYLQRILVIDLQTGLLSKKLKSLYLD